MYKIFYRPKETIKSISNIKWIETIAYFLAIGVIFAVSFLILGTKIKTVAFLTLGTWVVLILTILALTIALWVFTKKFTLKDITNVTILPWLILSIAFLLSAIFSKLHVVGVILNGIISLIAVIFAMSVQIKAISETFKLDLITTIIILTIIYIGASTAIAGIVSTLTLQLISKLGLGLLPIGFP